MNVPDDRFKWLCEQFNPKSEVPAFLEIVDIAGLVKCAAAAQCLLDMFSMRQHEHYGSAAKQDCRCPLVQYTYLKRMFKTTLGMLRHRPHMLQGRGVWRGAGQCVPVAHPRRGRHLSRVPRFRGGHGSTSTLG